MTTTTVRVTRSAHAGLLRLQEAWQRRRGERPAQTDLVDRLVAFAERRADLFIDEAAWRPWTPPEVERFFSALPVFDGPPDLSENVDRWVYGGADGEPRSP